VIWRPGKLRFLIGVKNPFAIRPTATARKPPPLPDRVGRQIRDLNRGCALLTSRIRRHVLILFAAQQCLVLQRTFRAFARSSEVPMIAAKFRLISIG
jgi:hypothetical protein